ncbi:unnamed protein product [Gongylonema pulchrum]|uniref:MFS domain-containing protein n=1 Tax=Gongylonema pulchrum TaxID=637853 RepID=A0A183DKM6_9BILA|nr:unnamed protein product [Gongylonema pulchrum]
MCDWLGATRTVQAGAVVNVVGSLLTPYVSRNVGALGVIIIRFLMGCGQGVLVPCMSVLIAHWFPVSEKSTAVAIATTGNQLNNWAHIGRALASFGIQQKGVGWDEGVAL